MRVESGYCYKKNEQIIFKELADGPALIDPYRRMLVKLNPTAQAIWQLVDGAHPAADIIVILQNEFAVDARTLERDVLSFFRDLIKREMIE